MRAILDTNILLAAIFWHRRPHQLLERVREGSLTLITSPTLFAEFEDVMGRTKFDAVLLRSRTSRTKSLDEVRRLAEFLDPPATCRTNIPILTPAQALERFAHES